MKYFMSKAIIVVGIATVLAIPFSSASAHCRGYHPHHCKIKKPKIIKNIQKETDKLRKNAMKAIDKKSLSLSASYKNSNRSADYEDCLVIVVGGLAVYGASKGGTIGAIAGGSVGAASARMACRKTFK